MPSRRLLSSIAFLAALLANAPALGVPVSGRVIWVKLCSHGAGGRQTLPLGDDGPPGAVSAGCHAVLCPSQKRCPRTGRTV